MEILENLSWSIALGPPPSSHVAKRSSVSVTALLDLHYMIIEHDLMRQLFKKLYKVL